MAVPKHKPTLARRKKRFNAKYFSNTNNVTQYINNVNFCPKCNKMKKMHFECLICIRKRN